MNRIQVLSAQVFWYSDLPQDYENTST